MDAANRTALDHQLALRFNAEFFACEIIDDELIMMNTRDGTYYCVGGSISGIWPSLVSGISLAAAVSEAMKRFIGEPDLIRSEILRMVELLVEDEIVIQTATWTAPGPAADDGKTEPFLPFSFEKHTDLQDLLTLDPIHEVDTAQGWPKPQS
jgi:hypothetical protein